MLPEGAVRAYSTTEGVQEEPSLAAKHGHRVTAGAWLDKRTDKNELELQSLVTMVRRYPNIDRVLVGNEAILRADVTVPEMNQ